MKNLKNIFVVILVTILFFALPSRASDLWSDADVKREAVYLAVDTVDWLQTRNIARDPNKWYETNSVLGEHPSVGKVNMYFATMMLVHIGIVDALPSEYRPVFQYTTIMVELNYVAHNYSLGISMKF